MRNKIKYMSFMDKINLIMVTILFLASWFLIDTKTSDHLTYKEVIYVYAVTLFLPTVWLLVVCASLDLSRKPFPESVTWIVLICIASILLNLSALTGGYKQIVFAFSAAVVILILLYVLNRGVKLFGDQYLTIIGGSLALVFLVFTSIPWFFGFGK
ncbi:MAG: hypothetical protein V1707_02700 [bacterium]